jgi:cytochrome b6-f complex iron-sulfur subunit
LNRDVLEIDLDSIPKSLARPTKIAGAYYLVRLPAGLIALHWLCPHLGSAVKWSEENTRFECVSHGGRYTLDGSYLTGPARRDMDQFVLHITTPDGTISTPADGSPVPIDDALSVVLDTRTKILGKPAVRRER